MPVSRSTALRRLRRLPLPELTVPRVIGVDDFALRRRHRYATIIIDAETGQRVAVLPGRDAAYQVRKWTPWYRHVTMCMLAEAFLTVTRASQGKDATLRESETAR